MKILDAGRGLTLASRQLVEVHVSDATSMQIRRGYLLGADARVEITDSAKASGGKQRSERQLKQAAGRAGALDLATAHGSGRVWLGRSGLDASIVEIEEGVTLLDQSIVVAAETGVVATLGHALTKTISRARKVKYAWSLTGGGQLAIVTLGQPTVVEVSVTEPVLVEANALLAYSAGIAIVESESYTGELLRRDVKAVLANANRIGLRFSIKGERQRIYVIAEGVGCILMSSPAN